MNDEVGKTSPFRDADSTRYPEQLTFSHAECSFIHQNGCCLQNECLGVIFIYFFLTILWKSTLSCTIIRQLTAYFSMAQITHFLLIYYYLGCSHTCRCYLYLEFISLDTVHPLSKNWMKKWSSGMTGHIGLLHFLLEENLKEQDSEFFWRRKGICLIVQQSYLK